MYTIEKISSSFFFLLNLFFIEYSFKSEFFDDRYWL